MKMCSNHIEFKVRINSWGRYRNLTLSMKPTDTINKLKDKLRVTKGVVSLNVRYALLLCNNKNLFDEDGSSMLINHWNKGEGDNQIVLCKKGSFHIRVHIPAGRFLIIEVNSLMTLLQFKETLSELMHGRLDFDLEMFAKYPMILVHRVLDKDEHCLGFYDIVKLPSELPNAQDIIVKFKTRFLGYKVSDAYVPLIVNASRFIITSCKIHIEMFAIGCSTLFLALSVKLSDTIDSLRVKILDQLFMYYGLLCPGYFSMRQYLVFHGRQILQDHSFTFTKCNIPDMPQDPQLFVYPSEPFWLEVLFPSPDECCSIVLVKISCLDSFACLKSIIFDRTGLPVDRQLLFCDGRLVYEDEKRLVDYGIAQYTATGSKSLHELQQDMPLLQLMPYNVVSQTSQIFDSKACEKLSDSKRYTSRIRWSFWKGVSNSAAVCIPLENFLKQPCCASFVEYYKIYVFIKFSESVTFRMMLWVGRGDTVKTVKNMIKERAKVQKDIIALTYIEEGEYMLLFNKQQLSEDDESTLKQCGVGDEGELLLYPRSSFHIRIFLVVYDLPYVDTIPDFQVLVNCMDNVDVVKAHITSHFGVVVDSLWYGKTRLSSERLLLDYDIVDHFVSKVSCWKCSEVRLTGYCVRRL